MEAFLAQFKSDMDEAKHMIKRHEGMLKTVYWGHMRLVEKRIIENKGQSSWRGDYNNKVYIDDYVSDEWFTKFAQDLKKNTKPEMYSLF